MNKKIIGVLSLVSILCLGAYVLTANASTYEGSLTTGIDSNNGNMDGIVIAAPTVSPAAGTYNSTQSVTLVAAGSTAICYTTDDSTPSCANATTCTNGTKYSSAISVAASATVKSLACYNNNSSGPVASSAYSLVCATTSVSHGSVAAYSSCAITCNSGYTLSGSTCVASGGGGGGGGGGSASVFCTNVVFGDWQTTCFSGKQYRNAVTQTPSSCVLTAAQILDKERVCQTVGVDATLDTEAGTGSDSDTGSSSGSSTGADSGSSNEAFVASEKVLVKSVSKALSNRLSGRILLQVEGHGESWYVNPVNSSKYFLGRPTDAFSLMRNLGLGISEKDYTSFSKSKVSTRLAGRILLRVQAHGEAYYVSPLDNKMYYMGRPADAFALMRQFGLGISNNNLRQIMVGEIK